VYTVKRVNPPPDRRAALEVAGWDGSRWVVEGVFDTGAEAAGASKHVLRRRLGVKVTEDSYNDREGIFKSRVVFTEYRDGVPKPDRRPAAAIVTPQARSKQFPAGTDSVLYVAISALVISIIAMLFSIAR
jgi:hypothetical protein